MAVKRTKLWKQLTPAIQRAVNDEIEATTSLVHGTMVGFIQKGPKSGTVYNLTTPSREHRASAPGQAPATDTGNLASHIDFATKLSRHGIIGSVGIFDTTNVIYAPRLEFGGSDSRGVYIAPRPFLRPALATHRKDHRNRVRAAVKRAIA